MSDPFENPKPAVGDPDDFLMAGGGVTAKFPKIGHSYTGIVLSKRSEQRRSYDDPSKLLFWDDGNPKMQAIVELQTNAQGTFDRNGNPEDVEDDDGKRSLYVKGQMQRAIRDAVRKANASTLEVGGKLTITYVGTGKQDNPKYNPPKLFRAEYVPAGQVSADDALMAGDDSPFSD